MSTPSGSGIRSLSSEDAQVVNQIAYLSHHGAVFCRCAALAADNQATRYLYSNGAEIREQILRQCMSLLPKSVTTPKNSAVLTLSKAYMEASQQPALWLHNDRDELEHMESQTLALFRHSVRVLQDRKIAQVLADSFANLQIIADRMQNTWEQSGRWHRHL